MTQILLIVLCTVHEQEVQIYSFVSEIYKVLVIYSEALLTQPRLMAICRLTQNFSTRSSASGNPYRTAGPATKKEQHCMIQVQHHWEGVLLYGITTVVVISASVVLIYRAPECTLFQFLAKNDYAPRSFDLHLFRFLGIGKSSKFLSPTTQRAMGRLPITCFFKFMLVYDLCNAQNRCPWLF